MAETRPERRDSKRDVSDDEIRKLIRKVNSDLENLERAARELERVARQPAH
jgi:hypothetical protein